MNVKQGFINLARYISLLVLTYIIFSFIFVIITIYDDLEITPALWKFNKPKDNQYVIAIVAPTRFGEKQQSIMIKEAATKMGHLVYHYSLNDKDMDLFLPAKYMNELLLYVLDKLFKPDFHLAMSFHVNVDLPSPKVMYISVPPRYYIDKVKDEYAQVNDYNNFLDINLINANKNWLKDILGKETKVNYGLVGVPANKYQSSPHDKLLLFGSLWGRKTDHLYSAIKELAKQDYMFFIRHNYLLLGLKDKQQFSEPAEGLAALQARLNQYGIGLCVHSQYHVEAGIPSSRIFEIISSGAVAISDKNPFVMKFFGDSILYFDQTESSEEIYKQINSHVRWIQSHPKQADSMARKAHQILQNNFTTEKFVQDLINMFPKSF